jgi:serine/threonine-protein kinase
MATVAHSSTQPTAFLSTTTTPRTPNFADQESSHSLVGRIGPWQLVRLLSESEMARVYVARAADAGQDAPASYVLKVLRNPWWRDPQAIEMQRRAAWIGRTLSHPNLLPVLSAGVQHPPFYLVSPKLAGQQLGRVLQDEAQLPTPVILWIVRQVAEALHALHETVGMIHADVKPANIMVSGEGHATLIDLGYAQSKTETRHWSSRPVVGTLHYIAPETITSSLVAEPSSDLYSLGVTFYQMLTGRLPFPVDDPKELVRLHREASPECVRQLVPDLPKPVASLVHRLLAKNPLRRPGSAQELACELTRLEIDCFGLR